MPNPIRKIPLKSIKKQASTKSNSKDPETKSKAAEAQNNKDPETKFNPPKLSSAPTNEYAYVCLMMRGDKYLPGVLTTMGSIGLTSSKIDRVVMVTNDVSEKAKQEILKVATHIAMIDYLTFKTKPLATERIKQLYESWNSSAYSKWNALALPYKKIVFLDADLGIFHNIDHLFDRPAPAFLCNSPFVKPCGHLENPFTNDKNIDEYGYVKDGGEIPAKLVSNSLKHGPLTVVSAIAILEPNENFFEEYISMLRKLEPFGYDKVLSTVDEQSIAYYYGIHKSMKIYNIYQRYNHFVWKNNYLQSGDLPYVLHWFAEKKPWSFTMPEATKYTDILTWYKLTFLVAEKYSIQMEYPEDLLNWAKTAEDTYAIKLFGMSNLKSIINESIDYKKNGIRYSFN